MRVIMTEAQIKKHMADADYHKSYMIVRNCQTGAIKEQKSNNKVRPNSKKK